MNKYLIWDFDGTLGYREGGVRGGRAWGASLLEVLDREMPGHGITFEMLDGGLRSEFPWHRWETPHPHLTTDNQWWEALYPVLAGGFRHAGVDAERAAVFARVFRGVYLNFNRWHLYDDVLPVLDALIARGWTHVILSNHVPELGGIVRHLGLASRIESVFNSAIIGYEKPHPRAFQIALEALSGAEAVWMIGDNVDADVQGAECVGIPAILVRRLHPDARYACEALGEVLDIVKVVR